MAVGPRRADFVEKVESRSFAEIRLNSSEIFDLIWLPLQIDYGHLGLTRPRIMRAPRVPLKKRSLRRGKNCTASANRLFQQNRPAPDSGKKHAVTQRMTRPP